MLKNGSFRQIGAVFTTITVGAVMLAAAWADPHGKQAPKPKSKKPNPHAAEPSKTTHNGHDHQDKGKKPNPASQSGKGHKHGHDKHKGHNHDDPDVGSVFDLLGIDQGEEEQETQKNSKSSQEPAQLTPPDTSSSDPFSEIATGESETEKSAREESGPAFGSVPLIRDDEESTNYVLEKLISGAQEAAWAKGETPTSTAALKAAYSDYATRLVQTLSRLSQEEQNFIFYGRKQ